MPLTNCSGLLRGWRGILQEQDSNRWRIAAVVSSQASLGFDSGGGWRLEVGGWRAVAGGWWPLIGRWSLVVGRWGLGAGGRPLAAAGWPLAVGRWPPVVGRRALQRSALRAIRRLASAGLDRATGSSTPQPASGPAAPPGIRPDHNPPRGAPRYHAPSPYALRPGL